MVKSAEEIWLDAIDSRERGNFDDAIRQAKEVVSIDEKNTEAWMAIATWSLPPPTKGKPIQPSLQQSASLSAHFSYKPNLTKIAICSSIGVTLFGY